MRLEREVEQRLVQKVRELGGKAYKFSAPGRRGVPDRICVFPGGRVVFVEVKAKRGRLSALQARECRQLLDLGCEVGVVRDDESIEEMLDPEKSGRL